MFDVGGVSIFVAFAAGGLQLIARVNPLTYLVNALRALMVQGGTSPVGLPVDFAVLAVVFIALIALGARLYPGIIR